MNNLVITTGFSQPTRHEPITLDYLIRDHLIMPRFEDTLAFEWATREVQEAFLTWVTLTNAKVNPELYEVFAKGKPIEFDYLVVPEECLLAT